MPSAPASTIRHRVTPQRGVSLHRPLRRWLCRQLPHLLGHLDGSIRATHADRYRKSFFATSHATLLLFHGLSRGTSLEATYAAFAAYPDLVRASGLAGPTEGVLAVSYSHLALSSHTRPAAFLAGLAQALMAEVRQAGLAQRAGLPLDLLLQDSTSLALSLALARWLPDQPGVRVQCQYRPALDLPEHLLVTDACTNDVQGFDLTVLDDPDRLATLRGLTLVIDLGYYSHARFRRLREAGVHVVCRLQGQACFVVEASLPVQRPLPDLSPSRVHVLSDQRILLGSPANRTGAVLPGMRLVTASVEPSAKATGPRARVVTYRIVTDRWDLSAQEVVQCYLWRWQIELFFRWMKHTLTLPALLGYSRNAVELTIWAAVVAHLLAVLASQTLRLRGSLRRVLEALAWAFAHLTPDDFVLALKAPTQPPLPP